jgi:hypothetical protein
VLRSGDLVPSARSAIFVVPEVSFPGWYKMTVASAGFIASAALWITAAPVSDGIADEYEIQVKSYRARYGKTEAWERYMLLHRDRYEHCVLNALGVPRPITGYFRYQSPVTYTPPWPSETEHMAALERLGRATFPGYWFQITMRCDPLSIPYVTLVSDFTLPLSRSTGATIYLKRESILGHEFGHRMGLNHHDDLIFAADRAGEELPPGETSCTMFRAPRGNGYCSACRTALNIPLDIDNAAERLAAILDINHRYPED